MLQENGNKGATMNPYFSPMPSSRDSEKAHPELRGEYEMPEMGVPSSTMPQATALIYEASRTPRAALYHRAKPYCRKRQDKPPLAPQG